jgi:hypothetical protein
MDSTDLIEKGNTMDFEAAMQKYRENFFSQYPPVSVSDLRPGMKIVVPEDPYEPGAGDLFMEVTSVGEPNGFMVPIRGKLTQAHLEAGDVGNEVVAQSPWDQVGMQSKAA